MKISRGLFYLTIYSEIFQMFTLNSGAILWL
jgi:hypothetical protein